jgi:hypothetical protein
MKQTIRAAAIAAVIAFGLPAGAATLSPACQAKHDEVAARLKTAKETGNSEQQSSLTRALAAIDSQCTDARLKSDYDKDVAKQEAKVKGRQADLDKATAGGKASKIKKAEGKLATEQAKLDKLKATDPLAPK